MPQELVGQVAIVTGGASGIGRATAYRLATLGASVMVFDRDAAAGHDVRREIGTAGTSAGFVEIDLADSEAIAPAVERVIDEHGRVDILVNAAGTRGLNTLTRPATVFDIDAATWDFVMAVNLRAPFLMTQAVARHQIERGRGGRIVNVSSSAAFQARHCSTHYAASKAGLCSLTRTAAANLGPHGINVNAVAPGTTRTPMLQVGDDDSALERSAREGPWANLLGRLSEAEDVAAVIVFLCLPASRQITGQTIHTSAGAIVHGP